MFYKDFQEKREELGLSLDQISQKTKISQETLTCIEKGEFDKLPDIYIRLFIKSYAQELGLNPEEYLKKYESETGSKKHDVKRNLIENDSKEKDKTSPPPTIKMSEKGRIVTFAVIFILIIFVIVILKQVLSENQSQTISKVHQRIMQQDSVALIDTLTPDSDKASSENTPMNNEDQSAETEINVTDIDTTVAASLTDSLRLGIEISDTCWVKIVLDGKDTSEAMFRPETKREWKALEKFDIRIGRPEVVKLFLNSTQLDSVDRGVAPARLLITKDGIVN